MNADADIQVWLETMARVRPSIVVPYLQSTQDRKLRYRLHTINQGSHGRSEISQGGVVTVTAYTPIALSQMSITHHKSDNCTIDLVLIETGVADRTYHFSCPDS